MSVERIQQHFRESAALKLDALDALSMPIAAAIDTLFGALANGNRIFACGNGAGAADAQCFAAHLLGSFERERPSLPAIALTADSSVLTGLSAGGAFDTVYAKQLRALGHAVPLLIAIDGAPPTIDPGRPSGALGESRPARLSGIDHVGRHGRSVSRRRRTCGSPGTGRATRRSAQG